MEGTIVEDAEAAFLLAGEPTGNEWELYKENVKPMKRGRNVRLLNEALRYQNDVFYRKSLFQNRKKLVEAIDEYKGDDPLQPWLECIKWVQESFPAGGEYSGLVVIYEQCVRAFWHSEQYKDDLRYLKVWLEYADNCSDAEVIYKFLEANEIGQTHSTFYISYAFHMESKHKLKKADEIFNLGIARKAKQLGKLESAYRKFLSRSIRSCQTKEEELMEDSLPARCFGTVLPTGESDRASNRQLSDAARKKAKIIRTSSNAPLAIYNDVKESSVRKSETSIVDMSTKGQGLAWKTLATRADRNKENTAVPAKWTSAKIPQKTSVSRGAASSGPCIQVFVDDEFAGLPATAGGRDSGKPSVSQQTKLEAQSFKKETDLLRENPLRHFPPRSLPR